MNTTLQEDPVGEKRPAPGGRRQRRVDLAIGIAVGVILGLAVISAFVFLGSEGSVDAPRISGVDSGKPEPHRTTDSGPADAGKRRIPPSNAAPRNEPERER